jgi:hypothetical protein
MSILGVFAVIWASMIAFGFAESSIEGKNAWDKKKYGWKIKFGWYKLTRYHFYLFYISIPIMLTVIPLVVSGWSLSLFGTLLSATISGFVIEDFVWFVSNTEISFKKSFNSKFANYYPWINIGKTEIPLLYIVGTIIAGIIFIITR